MNSNLPKNADWVNQKISSGISSSYGLAGHHSTVPFLWKSFMFANILKNQLSMESLKYLYQFNSNDLIDLLNIDIWA